MKLFEFFSDRNSTTVLCTIVERDRDMMLNTTTILQIISCLIGLFL